MSKNSTIPTNVISETVTGRSGKKAVKTTVNIKKTTEGENTNPTQSNGQDKPKSQPKTQSQKTQSQKTQSQKIQSQPKTQSKAQSKVQTQSQAKTQPQTQPQTEPQAETLSKSQPKNQPKSQPKNQSKNQESSITATSTTTSTSTSKSKKVKKDEISEDHSNETVETTESVDSKFEKLMITLNETRKNIADLQRQEKILIKKMSNVHKSELRRASNKKRRPNVKPTGFATPKMIGGRFADWLGVERGTMLTGPEISSAFWKRIKEEGLQYEDNKRIFRCNKEVAEIFNISDKEMKIMNKSIDPKDENGFNMRTYQTHIARALAHNNE